MRFSSYLLVVAALVVASITTPGCASSGSTESSFLCGDASPDCPLHLDCPTVPRGPRACGDVQGLFGHETFHVDGGRPIGCTVTLPYASETYPDQPQTCTCTDTGVMAGWICPL